MSREENKISKANAKWLTQEKKCKTREQLDIAHKNLKNKHCRKDEWSGTQYKSIRG